jgi:hypothetical protein
MSIASSVIVSSGGSPLYVHEQHTAHTGQIVARFYVAAPGADLDANLAAYALVVAEQLAEQEAESVVNG